ncbi:MAG: outer membrane protein assembly factor BamB [Verrucomicrobiales bacterium]|jgi:outer membrane protein assembly factor BamB
MTRAASRLRRDAAALRLGMRNTFLILLLAVAAAGAQAQSEFDRLTSHAAPKPLAEGALTEDWPRFLGAHDNSTSAETHLLREFPEGGPTLLWEVARGQGYAAPAIVGDRLLHYHNLDDVDVLECLHAVTGKQFWEVQIPNKYRDRYGFANGPRASPTVVDGKIYTLSVTSWLRCHNLDDGKLIWERDLATDYKVPQYFFGHGPTPLIVGDRVIMNIGGEKGVCVGAFHKDTGETIWETKHVWQASYASPQVAEFHGKQQILVFAGGESDPPIGGLLLIDPETGKLHDEFPWRGKKFESATGSSPFAIGNNRVLISETYTEGAVLLEVDESFKFEEVWKAPEFKLHWMQPLLIDDHFYAFTGRNEPDAGLDCWKLDSGERAWREEFMWPVEVNGQSFKLSFFRGSLLQADDTIYTLGEMGTLGILDLSPKGGTIRQQVDLFTAQSSWTPPAVSKGLLYICQNSRGLFDSSTPRLLCYDLRRSE